jgi:hypothetical protein
MASDIETYFENDAWWNWVQGGEQLGGPYPSQDEAVAAGREAARERNVEHVIRDEQATIVERDDFGDGQDVAEG